MNEKAIEELRTLVDWVLLSCKSIDDATAADTRWSDTPPGWWLEMRRLEDAARRCKTALPAKVEA